MVRQRAENSMIQFAHILCPIDFSDASIRALTYAAAFAAWYGAELEVLHVVPAFEESGEPQERHRTSRREPMSREDITAAMRRSLRDVGALGVSPKLLAREGRVHEAIAARAHEQPSDLLVMGTHGRSGFNRLLLGSVTEKVLRTVRCPVLTVSPAAAAMTTATVAFEQILCPIDYSPSAARALQYALELGRQTGGCVSVLYALEYMDPEEPCEHVDFDIRRHRQHFVEHARARLHSQLTQASTSSGEINEIVAIDRAYKAILHTAAAMKADLIVMGAQGTGGLELMVYGSNTQHVVRAATCPVLTVHA
jgi:nucleotide-binding universal stress UspA family protein